MNLPQTTAASAFPAGQSPSIPAPSTPEVGGRGFLARHGLVIAGLALLGAVLGTLIAVLMPAQYRSDVGVLITIIGDDDLPIEETLENDAAFANSETVLNRVRGTIPEAPDTVDVAIDAERSIVRITASATTADEALRLARTWSSAFISERRRDLIDVRSGEVAEIEAELSGMVTAIGTARLAAEDDEVLRLEARRDELAAAQASLENDLSALQSGIGAEVVESPVRPDGRSGVGLLPALIAGIVLGSLAGAALSAWNDRDRRRLTEADAWLDDPTFTPIDLVELAAVSAEEDAALTTTPTLQDLAPIDLRPSEPVDLGGDGLGPSIFAEPPSEPAFVATPTTDPAATPIVFESDQHAVTAADGSRPALLDLTAAPAPARTDRSRPTPGAWLQDPSQALGRTRVPASGRESAAEVRVVDLTDATLAGDVTDRVPVGADASLAYVDDWSDDLSLLPD